MSLSVRSPFPAHAWPMVWQWMQPFMARVSDDFSPRTQEDFVEIHLEMQKQAKTWGVWRDGELGGLIWVEQRTPILAQSHVIFKRAFWGRGTTEAAMRSVYEQVFRNGTQKIASYVFETNHAIISLARAIGARHEGTLRHQTTQNGQPVNMVALGLLREDFEHATGSNHGGNGRRIGNNRTVGQPQQNVNEHDSTELHARADVDATHPGGSAGHGSPGPVEGTGTAEDAGSGRDQ